MREFAKTGDGLEVSRRRGGMLLMSLVCRVSLTRFHIRCPAAFLPGELAGAVLCVQ